MTVEEFAKHFKASNPHYGLLTEEIFRRVANMEYISVPKL